MCGIVGVVQYKSEIPRHVRQKALRILFSDIMLRTEVRGEDATGLYQVHTDGDWLLAKKGVKVSNWLFLNDKNCGEDPVIYSNFMDSWLEHPQELTALVGHCRKATVGSKGEDNEDNHPFSVQLDERNAILGVHNGTLSNHEKIFEMLPSQLTRQGSVDSESIFHLLFHLSEEGSKPFDGEMLKTLGSRLDGSYACIVVNSRFPNTVAAFREGRPLEYYTISPLNIIVLASDKKFIASAIKKYNFIRLMLDKELPELETWDASILDRDYRVFDTTKDFGKGKPDYQTMERISEKGEMRKHHESVDPEWKATTNSSPSSSTQGSYQQGRYSAKTTTTQASESEEDRGAHRGVSEPKTSKPNATLSAQASNSAPSNEGTRVIEMELGSEEDAGQGLERARALGLCPTYTGLLHIGDAIGMTPKEVNDASPVFLTNRVAQTNFCRGYALARVESRTEAKKWREGGIKLARRLEHAQRKKDAAQQHVWANTHLLAVATALSQSGYEVTLHNMYIAIGHLPKITREGSQQLEEAAKGLFEGLNFRKTVEELSKGFRAAKKRGEKTKKAQEQAAS